MHNTKKIIEYVLDLSFFFYLWHTKERKEKRSKKNSQIVRYFTLFKVMYRYDHKYMNTLHLSLSGLRYDISHLQKNEDVLEIFFFTLMRPVSKQLGSGRVGSERSQGPRACPWVAHT